MSGLTRVQRLETRAVLEDASGTATEIFGSATGQVADSYDSLRRLTSVTADLTPADDSTADNVVFVATYTHDGASTRIASVTHSDRTSVVFAYDAAGRVSTIKDPTCAPQLVLTYRPATSSTDASRSPNVPTARHTAMRPKRLRALPNNPVAAPALRPQP